MTGTCQCINVQHPLSNMPCPGYVGVKGNDRDSRLAGKATIGWLASLKI